MWYFKAHVNLQHDLCIEFKSMYEPSIYDRGPLKDPPRYFKIKKIYGDVKRGERGGYILFV